MSECKYINLYIKQTASIPKRAQVLQEWHRQELKNILQPLIAKWESLISVKASCWEVKRMKTLWGSAIYAKENCFSIWN
jgi:predicted metal-dependent hydrolase